MYCSNCGKQIPDGSAFCPECGAKLGGDSFQSKVNGLAGKFNKNSFLDAIKNPDKASLNKSESLLTLGVFVITTFIIIYNFLMVAINAVMDKATSLIGSFGYGGFTPDVSSALGMIGIEKDFGNALIYTVLVAGISIVSVMLSHYLKNKQGGFVSEEVICKTGNGFIIPTICFILACVFSLFFTAGFYVFTFVGLYAVIYEVIKSIDLNNKYLSVIASAVIFFLVIYLLFKGGVKALSLDITRLLGIIEELANEFF